MTDIKDFLSKQWSDMFKNYLSILRESNKDDKLIDTVGELKTLVKQMNVMLDKVGSRVLQKNGGNDYKEAIKLQQVISVADKITLLLSIHEWYVTDSYEKRMANVDKLLHVFKSFIEVKRGKYLEGSDTAIISDMFDFFLENKIVLGTVGLAIVAYFEAIIAVLYDDNAVIMLQNELSSEVNYMQLCYTVDFIRDVEIDGGDEG